MFVAEIRIPGDHAVGMPVSEARVLESVFDYMRESLGDAAVSLHLFEQAYGSDVEEQRARAGQTSRRIDAARVVEAASHTRAPETPEERKARESGLREAAERNRAHLAWETGEWPYDYAFRLVFVHAKSFVYSLDAIGSALNDLSHPKRYPNTSATVAPVCAQWRATLPTLHDVRNSSQHQEQRIREYAGKPLYSSNLLGGHRYEWSLGDGTLGSVAVTAATLTAAARVVQAAHDAFQWSGEPRWSPL